jgi:cold shock CspA family protein
METGIVKFFNLKSHFGFIIDPKNGREYYVHEKDLIDKIQDGDEVKFETKELKRGTVAVKVSKKQSQ